jgi:phage virion morphogenesis protein
MTTFTIEVKDEAVQALLAQLSQRLGNLRPVLQAIGSDITERTKRRFETSTAPDGTPWKPNSAATLAMLAARIGGQKSKVKKDGSLNAAGLRSLGNKKPLIGESQDLRRQIVPSVSGNTLTVVSTPVYAAIHQFGGQAGRGRKVTIPARPFLPVRADGTLYPDEQRWVLDALNEFLSDGV